MKISINKFLLCYYGIKLDLNVKYSHKELKKFLFLKRCSFEFAADNSKLVNCGKIIFVSDSYGDVIPYIVDDEIISTYNLINESEFDERIRADDNLNNSKINNNNIKEELKKILTNISKISTYDVRKLLSKYKDVPSIYRLLKRELKKRGVYDNKIYKLDKELIKVEEKEKNDKYKRRQRIKRNES